MYGSITSLEIMRWGFAHLPGAILYYAKELELDPEDIGLLATLFYAFENIKPLFQSGVTAGQVLQCCPAYSKAKLSKRLNILSARGVVGLSNSQARSFGERTIYLEPLMDRLEELIVRDHPRLMIPKEPAPRGQNTPFDQELMTPEQGRQQREELESQPAPGPPPNSISLQDNKQGEKGSSELQEQESYRKVADFISKKTGNLISPKMDQEIRTWFAPKGFNADFLLMMLELCFDRKITNPRDIGRIVADLKKYSIGSVEGLNLYFKKYIDEDPGLNRRHQQFDPEIIDFGSFVGLDMSAEARRRLYYKWRFEWNLDRSLVMKAGELMCQRTSNGGLEYVDSVLSDWKNKGLATLEEVEAEIAAFKKQRKEKGKSSGKSDASGKGSGRQDQEYSVYVPPELLESLKKAPSGS